MKNIEFKYSLPEIFIKELKPNFHMIYSLINDILIENL